MDRRRDPRIESYHLVRYTVDDRDGQPLKQGKGLTLNLSRSGVLLETLKQLNGARITLMTCDQGGSPRSVKGRIIYSSIQKATGRCLSGIELVVPPNQAETVGIDIAMMLGEIGSLFAREA